jgi:hypothetical protein
MGKFPLFDAGHLAVGQAKHFLAGRPRRLPHAGVADTDQPGATGARDGREGAELARVCATLEPDTGVIRFAVAGVVTAVSGFSEATCFVTTESIATVEIAEDGVTVRARRQTVWRGATVSARVLLPRRAGADIALAGLATACRTLRVGAAARLWDTRAGAQLEPTKAGARPTGAGPAAATIRVGATVACRDALLAALLRAARARLLFLLLPLLLGLRANAPNLTEHPAQGHPT